MMAEGSDSKRAWEIINSHHINSSSTTNHSNSNSGESNTDPILDSPPVEYQDLVDGWHALLSTSQGMAHSDCDVDSSSVPIDTSGDKKISSVTCAMQLDTAASLMPSDQPAEICLETESAYSKTSEKKLFQLQPSIKPPDSKKTCVNTVVDASHPKSSSAQEHNHQSSDTDAKITTSSCENDVSSNLNSSGSHLPIDPDIQVGKEDDGEVEDSLKTVVDMEMEDEGVADGKGLIEHNGVVDSDKEVQDYGVVEVDGVVEVEEENSEVDPSVEDRQLGNGLMQRLDSLTDSLSVLDANLAQCQIEKHLLEEEFPLETTPYGDGERYVLYPDLENCVKPDSEEHMHVEEPTEGASLLERQIRELIQTRNLVVTSRIERWAEEIDNECEIGNEDIPCYISTIPDEVLLKILSYIPLRKNITVISLVCKRWYILAADPSLWQQIYIPVESEIEPHWLAYLASRAPHLKLLSVRGGRNIMHESLSVVTSFCPQLTDVDFGFCNITTEMLQFLVTRCPNIHSVNFEGCECVNTTWVKTLCLLKKLRYVNLSHCVHVEDNDIIYLSDHLSSLVYVHIDGNSFLTDRCVVALCSKHKQTLVKLCLDGAESTDVSVRHAVTCSNLQLFTISFADMLTNKSVDYLETSEWLRHLQIRKNKLIDERSLERLFLSMSMQHLYHLDLTECVNVTDVVVKAICNRCPKLEKLILGWCWNVTDIGVEYIVDTCGNLDYLDLLGLDVIEGHSFDKLPVKLSKLTFLNLVQCNKIDDALMLRVLGRMPQLTAINFYHEDFRTAF